MPRIIYTAVDPNGTEHRRTTADRVYTHTVVARHSYEFDIANLDADARQWDTYAYHLRESDPATANGGTSPEKLARHKAAIQGCTSEADYLEKLRREKRAGIEANKAKGFYDAYGNYGWAGRPDLAQTSAARLRKGGRLVDVTILDAIKKGA